MGDSIGSPIFYIAFKMVLDKAGAEILARILNLYC